MPNWTQNLVTIKSSDKETMDKFLKAGKPNKKGNRSEGKYSFESWIPMPRTFHKYDTTNYRNGDGLIVGKPLSWRKDSPVVTEETIKKFKAATAYQKKRYGVIGWYDFGLKYWGTKWNASFDISRLSDTEVRVEVFDTAWSAPLEFFEAIAKKFGLYIDMLSHYEDCDNRCFIIDPEGDGEYYGDIDYTEMRDEFLRRVDEDDTLTDEQKVIRRSTVDKFFTGDYWFCTSDVECNWADFNDWFIENVETDDSSTEDDSEEETENA